MVPKCKYCENDCSKHQGPNEIFSFTIPYTQIEVRVWDWNSNAYMHMCESCLCEEQSNKEQETFREAYNYGLDKGYDLAKEEYYD